MKFYYGVKKIDVLLSEKATKEKIEELLALIREDNAFQKYFFSNVDDIGWFDDLKKQGYFNPQNAPGPKPADKEGLYSIPWWNALDYLEKVSEQIKIPGNEQYIDELLQIIRDVSTYTDQGKHIDNFHTWRSFVTILLNIPRERIPDDIIGLIPVWLDSKFDVSHVGSAIGLELLPEFLLGNPRRDDIAQAEKIIDYITDIKKDEEKTSLYKRGKQYKLKIGQYYVKKTFEKNAKDIGEKCTNKVIEALRDRIRFLLKRDVSLIPFEIVDKAYLLALSSEKEKYLVRVFEMGEKSESSVYEYVFMQKKLEGSPVKEITMDETALDEFSSYVFDELTKDVPFNSINEKELRRDIYRLYSNFHDGETYASFYDESRSHSSDPLEVLTFALKSTLLVRAGKHIDQTKEILMRFFNDNYLFFPKMALYIIGNNIGKYDDVLFEALEKDKSNLIFGEIYFGDELRHVLEKLLDLSSSKRDILIEKIEQGPGYVPKEDADMHTAKWKQERYSALSRDQEFKERCELLKSRTGVNVGLHSAVGEIKTRSGWGPSPLNKEEILQMLSTNELPSYLKDFKSKGFWEDGATVGGLAKLIKECAAENQDKFIDNSSQLNDTGFIYVYEILDGIKEAWNNKQDIAWGKLLGFIYQYIDRREFWEDHFIVEKDDFLGGANHYWIIGVVNDLIREASRDDTRPFDETYLKKSEQIIFLIFENLEVEEKVEISDYVTHALNSSHGKALSAFINLALRIARTNDKKGDKADVKWSTEIKGTYNELLEKKIIESYTFLGRYLPNLVYLDKVWAEGKVKDLYPELADRLWEAFMDGYLSIGTIYNDLYKIMSPHYEFGISHEFKEKHDNEHLVQHIALGYLLDFEKKPIENQESLIRKVLDSWKPAQILDIVNLLSSQQRHLEEGPDEDEKVVEKIIFIWKWIHDNKYENKTEAEITTDDKKIQSALSGLTVFLPCVNEEYSKWLMLAAPYANENYNSSFFIEYLDEFEDTESLEHIGRIFLRMLDYFMPDFDMHHIRSIVTKLYRHNQADIANEICEYYGKHQQDDPLRELWEQHNS